MCPIVTQTFFTLAGANLGEGLGSSNVESDSKFVVTFNSYMNR